MADVADIIGMLDRDDALRLDEMRGDYGAWPEPAESEVALPVDFGGLGRDDPAMEELASMPDFDDQYSAGRESRGISVRSEVVDTVLAGDAGLRGRDNAFPPPDVLAWYQPIHFFANNWGIFIRESSVIQLAADLAPRFARFEDRRSRYAHVAVLLRAAFTYAFLHEHYHHKVESLALRLHVVERRLIYPDYVQRVSNVVAGTDDAIEEALANADAWRRLANAPYNTWFKRDEMQVVREWMRDTFRASPPGYRFAQNLLGEPTFLAFENRLVSQVQEARASVRREHVQDFGIATHLNRSMFNLKQNVWTLVPVGQRSILPTLDGVLPLATAALEKHLLRQGWEYVKGGKGSHSKYRKPGQGMIVLPHRKDVSMTVLASTARTLGCTTRQLSDVAG